MEDAVIQALDDGAGAYAAVRDRRMALTAEEVQHKGALLTLMQRHGKLHYQHNGIKITVVEGEDSIKVRTAKSDHVE